MFLILFLVGIVILPAAIYFVGSSIFGDYGDSGLPSFYGTLLGELQGGEPAVWFLVLSPYLVWQLLRLTFRAFRIAGRR